jgi:hypothetical protein
MLKYGKYNSKDKHNLISALPGLDRKKKSFTTYWHIVVLLNLKFQLDMFKTNEEKAIIVFFCSFGFSGFIFLKVTITYIMLNHKVEKKGIINKVWFIFHFLSMD